MRSYGEAKQDPHAKGGINRQGWGHPGMYSEANRRRAEFNRAGTEALTPSRAGDRAGKREEYDHERIKK